MKANTLFRRLPKLAKDPGDFLPIADAAELLDELRAPMPPFGPTLAPAGHRIDLADDPSYCCEGHERLADQLRAFGGASAVGENVAAAFERRVLALDAQCPKAVTP